MALAIVTGCDVPPVNHIFSNIGTLVDELELKAKGKRELEQKVMEEKLRMEAIASSSISDGDSKAVSLTTVKKPMNMFTLKRRWENFTYGAICTSSFGRSALSLSNSSICGTSLNVLFLWNSLIYHYLHK
jgi:hypothetical protein